MAATDRIARFDPTSLDLTDLDLAGIARTTVGLAASATERASGLARDATYVTVGLGLLSFQRLQVRRREFERALRR